MENCTSMAHGMQAADLGLSQSVPMAMRLVRGCGEPTYITPDMIRSSGRPDRWEVPTGDSSRNERLPISGEYQGTSGVTYRFMQPSKYAAQHDFFSAAVKHSGFSDYLSAYRPPRSSGISPFCTRRPLASPTLKWRRSQARALPSTLATNIQRIAIHRGINRR